MFTMKNIFFIGGILVVVVGVAGFLASKDFMTKKGEETSVGSVAAPIQKSIVL